jgi:hypothetical protein
MNDDVPGASVPQEIMSLSAAVREHVALERASRVKHREDEERAA